MNTANESKTRLQGRKLFFARVAFGILAGLMLLVGVASFWFYFTREGWQICNGTTVECQVRLQYSVAQAADFARRGIPFENVLAMRYAALLLSSFVSLGVGLFIAARRSDDWMALLVAFVLISAPVSNEGVTSALTRAVPEAGLLVAFLNKLSVPLFLLVLGLFPNGRPAPAWMRVGLPIAIVLAVIVTNLSPTNIQWDLLVRTFVILAVLGLLLYSQIVRYRRYSTFAERKQTKWAVLGFVLYLLTFMTGIVLFSLDLFGDNQLLRAVVGTLCFTLLPIVFLSVCIGIAILRSRLWDIDILIRRTVTYAIVVALLAIVYFGSVILLQQIFSRLTGLGGNEIITVLSTLAIAALFVPLRNRIQNAIDKRFNRRKYNAQRVLQKFGETVRDETDIDKLTAELVNVVQETMQPKSVRVWLKRTEDGRRTKEIELSNETDNTGDRRRRNKNANDFR